MYRMPNGETTHDPDVYGQAWKVVMDLAEDLFPGYEVAGVDPGVQLVRYGKNGLGVSVVMDRIVLSVEALKLLETRLTSRPVSGTAREG